MRKPLYFRGQGMAKFAKYGSNEFKWLGPCSAVSLKPTVEELTHTEDYTGHGFEDFHLPINPKLMFSATVDDYFLDTLALGMVAEKTTLEQNTVTDRVIKGPFKAGQFYRIGRPGIQVSTLTAGASVLDASKYVVNFDGTVEFKEAVAGDITVDGIEPVIDGFGALSKLGQDITLMVEIKNTADKESQKRLVVVIGRMSVKPLSELNLIQKDLGKYTLEGSVLHSPEMEGAHFPGLADVFFEVAA